MPATPTDRLAGVTTSVAVKAPVKAVSTANLTLSGLQTVGGVVLAEGDRVLVKDQTTGSQNGIYVASATTWTRSKDFDGARDVVQGTIIPANYGTDTGLFYRVETADPITIGTTSIAITATVDPNQDYPITEAEAALSITPVNTSYPEAHAFRLLSGAKLADVRAFSFGQNTDTELQNTLDVAWISGEEAYTPRGGFLTTGITLPGNAVSRDRSFTWRGSGIGEIFDRSMTGATILKSVTDAPILEYTPDSPNTGNGSAFISGLRLEGDSATAYLIDFGSFYAQSILRECALFQNGNGGGIRVQLANTSTVEDIYAINADWNTNGLGAARTGIGFNFTNTIDTGLTQVRKTTSRGFLTGYNVGGGAGKHYSFKLDHFECSVVRNGVTLGSNVEKATINDGYFEGGDGGTGVLDEGDYNTLSNLLIFSGFGVGIDASAVSSYGTDISCCLVSAGAVANTVLMKLGSSGAYGGPGKFATRNTFTFSGSGGTSFTAAISGTTMTVSAFGSGTPLAVGMSIGAVGVRLGTYITALGTGTGGTGTYTLNQAQAVSSVAMTAGSIAGVIGIQYTGIDPAITSYPNAFDARGPWLGTYTTKKFDDQSTSSDGTTGSGLIGINHAQSIDGQFVGPSLRRGAINLKVDETVLDNNYLSTGGVLTLGELSAFTLALTSTAQITGFSSPNLPDKTFSIHCSSGSTGNRPQFVHGTNLRLHAGANYTPPSGGAWLNFQIKPGGVAYLTAQPVEYST
jgi:hypothetical protein